MTSTLYINVKIDLFLKINCQKTTVNQKTYHRTYIPYKKKVFF